MTGVAPQPEIVGMNDIKVYPFLGMNDIKAYPFLAEIVS